MTDTLTAAECDAAARAPAPDARASTPADRVVATLARRLDAHVARGTAFAAALPSLTLDDTARIGVGRAMEALEYAMAQALAAAHPRASEPPPAPVEVLRSGYAREGR